MEEQTEVLLALGRWTAFSRSGTRQANTVIEKEEGYVKDQKDICKGNTGLKG